MADVFTVLAQDHEEVKGMLAELEKGPTRASGANQDQLALRKKMTEQLIIEESKHEALEEMYFWPAVRDHLPDGDTLADQATGQEQEAKQVLARLDKLGAGDAEFEELLGTFTRAAREHIVFEETAVWPRLRTALNAERAAELGTQIAEGKKGRAHPAAPAHAALAGRAEDRRACRRRGGQGTRRGDRARRLIRPGRYRPWGAGTGRRRAPRPVRAKRLNQCRTGRGVTVSQDRTQPRY
jgi:hypothetical protein